MAQCRMCNKELSGKQTRYCSKLHSVQGYQKDNRERFLQTQRTRHSKNKLCKPTNAMYTGIKSRAKKKNIEFNLSLEDIVIPKVCPVLGIEIFYGESGCSPNSPSVDRIDNNKGYTKDNIIVISNRANFIKRDATLDELEKIVSFYKEMKNVNNVF